MALGPGEFEKSRGGDESVRANIVVKLVICSK